MNVQIISKTIGVGKYENLNNEEIISAIARHGVIKEDNGKLVKYLMDNAHWSPLDMINFTFEIETSRAIGRQILRHASIKFQEHCVTGDTIISFDMPSGNHNGMSIEDLYRKWHFGAKPLSKGQVVPMRERLEKMNIRVYDVNKKEIVTSHIKNVFYNGRRTVYKVTLKCGRSIKCTASHRFFSDNKFIELKNLKEGNLVATNGLPAYQNYDWLKNKKDESIVNKRGVQYIAGGRSERKLIQDFINSRRQEIYNLFSGKPECNQCGNTNCKIELHHIEPVSKNPFKAYDLNNIEPLCKDCHKLKHKKMSDYKSEFNLDTLDWSEIRPKTITESLSYIPDFYRKKSGINNKIGSRKSIGFSEIKKIEEVGIEKVYDLEVQNESHNYIANRIVVHNSTRYSDRVKFESIELRKEDKINRQSSTEIFDPLLTIAMDGDEIIETNNASNEINKFIEYSNWLYKELLNKGVAKECARNILPECLTTTISCNGTLRSWLSFLNVRLDHHAQKECQEIAQIIGNELEKELPNVFSTIDWKKGMFM